MSASNATIHFLALTWYLPLQTGCAMTSRPGSPKPHRASALADAIACSDELACALLP